MSTTITSQSSVQADPADSTPVTATHYVETQNTSDHTVRTVDGHKVSVTTNREDDYSLNGEFDDRVKGLITQFDQDRQAKEDQRANKRNFNRMLTLLFALVIGFVVTFALQHAWFGAWGPRLSPYSFCITVLLDTGLTVYAYIRRY